MTICQAPMGVMMPEFREATFAQPSSVLVLPSRDLQTRTLRWFQACNFAGRRRTFRLFSLERVQKYWCTRYFAQVAISGAYGRRPFGLKAAFLAMKWLVDALGGGGPRGDGHGAGLASQLGCRGGRTAKS